MAEARARMVQRQLIGRGIRDKRVLQAFREVRRHLFVESAFLTEAYSDFPLPIGHAQTISQPYIVAAMVEAMEIGPDSVVLEIGTGSGYETAILAELASRVYTVEVIPELAEEARKRLTGMGYSNIHYRIGDGAAGWPEAGRFDGIIVSAAPRRVDPRLLDQLADGACCIVPEGDERQLLRKYRRRGDDCRVETLMPVRFVPLVGTPDSSRER
ncbi:MAG: protein-L-isoaspartate(D-aspartate) O-methyltransferase [Opitutaceae bacterium]